MDNTFGLDIYQKRVVKIRPWRSVRFTIEFERLMFYPVNFCEIWENALFTPFKRRRFCVETSTPPESLDPGEIYFSYDKFFLDPFCLTNDLFNLI